jgi:hypothetical protein
MGCRTPMELNNVQTLTTHPQFPRAAQAAPEFTEAALRTVADLEYQIERRRK